MSRLSRAMQLQHSRAEMTRAGRRAVLQVARRTPMPAPLRHSLQAHFLWSATPQPVPVDRILLGSQNGLAAATWASLTDDLLWPSRPVAAGPHAALLREAKRGHLSDSDILASEYAAMARDCVRHTGDFFGARDDTGILAVARGRVSEPVPSRSLPRQTPPGQPIKVAPIRDSDCYQVIDGHHRVAAMAVAGVAEVPALVRRIPESTPLQDLLDRMSWIGGAHELYQPVTSPELEQSWRTVRQCTDRLNAMRTVLDELGLAGGTHLDVASCYGWFVSEMTALGFASEGVEADPLAPQLGSLLLSLDPARITVSDAIPFLNGDLPDAGTTRTWDVVTCFSLLHHFALGRGSATAAQLVRLLGRATGQVLFLDTGQEHERWFHDRLPEWDAAYIANFLRCHGGFDEVIDLGPDQDAVAPYQGNYGRHLFAAIRR